MKKLCEDAAMAMYREGRLDQEIADAIGYSRVSVTNWRNDRGLPSNRKRRTEKMIDAYKAAMPLERVQELAQAEKDGRLVVLPCKVGDTVFAAETNPVIPLVVVHVGVILDGKDGEDWESLDNFGKTVFLTREEAEAALKKEEASDEAD